MSESKPGKDSSNPAPIEHKLSTIISKDKVGAEIRLFYRLSQYPELAKYHPGKPYMCEITERDFKRLVSEKRVTIIPSLGTDYRKYRFMQYNFQGSNLANFEASKLNTYLEKKENKKKFWENTVFLWTAIRDFAKNNIIHDDIRPENLVFSQKTGEFRFINFGSMKKIVTEPETKSLVPIEETPSTIVSTILSEIISEIAQEEEEIIIEPIPEEKPEEPSIKTNDICGLANCLYCILNKMFQYKILTTQEYNAIYGVIKKYFVLFGLSEDEIDIDKIIDKIIEEYKEVLSSIQLYGEIPVPVRTYRKTRRKRLVIIYTRKTLKIMREL
jgi:serine/threonine protein kinase